MLLTIDAGNTNTVFALFDDERKMRGHWRISTDARRTSDEYAVWLNQLMALSRIRPIEISGAIIASVVPSATFNLLGLCRHHYSCEALIVGAEGVELGVEAKIKNPSEAGADRLVNTVGARMRFYDWGFDVYSNSLIVNNGFLADNPEAVRAFVAATIEGVEYAMRVGHRVDLCRVRWPGGPAYTSTFPWHKAIKAVGIAIKSSHQCGIDWPSRTWRSDRRVLL